MEKFFSTLGKVVLVILLLGSIAGVSYHFGRSKGQKTKEVVTDYNSIVTPTSTVSEGIKNPTPTSTPLKTITGGVNKSAGLSFVPYQVKTPMDWVEERESQTPADEKLILKKGDYQISIFQAATGGVVCLYPGDPDFEGPSSRYESFFELQTRDGFLLRRSGNKNGTGYSVCQKNSEGDFGAPTSYGHISLSLPINFDQNKLTEIDSIITSLQKR